MKLLNAIRNWWHASDGDLNVNLYTPLVKDRRYRNREGRLMIYPGDSSGTYRARLNAQLLGGGARRVTRMRRTA